MSDAIPSRIVGAGYDPKTGKHTLKLSVDSLGLELDVPIPNSSPTPGGGDVVGPSSATDGHLAVFDGADGKKLKDGGAVPGGGGGLTVTNVARVDPSGDDATGAVGDQTKPFLTVQAAVTALELASPDNPVVDLGANSFTEDITTSLRSISFVGITSFSPNTTNYPSIIGTITFTFNGNHQVVTVNGVQLGDLIFTNTDNHDVTVNGVGQYLITSITRSTGGGGIQVNGQQSLFADTGTASMGDITATGGVTVFYAPVNSVTTPGNVGLTGVYVVGSVSSGDLFLQDSYIGGVTTASSITRSDVFLNPVNFDFSTLPTTEPSKIGAAWIDTTGGNNIVKVKL